MSIVITTPIIITIIAGISPHVTTQKKNSTINNL